LQRIQPQKNRIVTLYQTVHDAIHAKSGQTGNLKLQYIRTEKEIVMGWVRIWLLNTAWSDLVASDNATIRAVCGLIAAITQSCGNQRCERSYSVGEETRRTTFPEGCPGLLIAVDDVRRDPFQVCVECSSLTTIFINLAHQKHDTLILTTLYILSTATRVSQSYTAQ
jgi:hypothetical protein